MSAADPSLVALVGSYQAQTTALRAALEQFVRALWASLGIYRQTQQAQYVKEVLPVILGAQQQMSAMTTAFAGYQRQQALGGAFRAVAVDPAKVTGRAARLGTPPAEVHARPFHLLWRQLKDLPRVEGSIESAIEAGLERAVDLAVDDIQLAKQHTAAEIGASDTRIKYVRRILEGPHSCGLCIVASTQRYHPGQLMPIHGGCVPPGTVIAADSVEAMTRRWYEGDLVTFSTAGGDQLTVTTQHPVLTDQGWLPAYLVGVGNNLVRNFAGHGAVGSRPDERHSPTLVEDVWRSASVDGFVTVPLAPEDLHGDGADGEIDIVRAYGDLASVGNVQFRQPRGESLLVDGHRPGDSFAALGGLALLHHGNGPASARVMGSRRLSGSLFRGHLCSTHQASLGASTNGHSRLGKTSANHTPRDAMGSAQLQPTGSSFVGGGDLLLRERDLPGSASRSSRFDAPAGKYDPQSRSAYADRGRALLDRLAGAVELDCVVEVGVRQFSGHVYNLHTSGGWYSADSHIVSNCDCSTQWMWADEDPGQILDLDLLQGIHDRIEQRFGTSNPSARRIGGTAGILQYSDVLVTHDHGELGPVLGVRGQQFTGPSDL